MGHTCSLVVYHSQLWNLFLSTVGLLEGDFSVRLWQLDLLVQVVQVCGKRIFVNFTSIDGAGGHGQPAVKCHL